MLRLVLVLPLAAAVSGFVPALKASDGLFLRDNSGRPLTDACTVADEIAEYCETALDEDASDEVKAACLCCDGSSALVPTFKTCEEYISAEYTSAYSAVATLQAFCDSVSADGFACAASTTTSSSFDIFPTSYVSSSVSPGEWQISGPPACTSVFSVAESCRPSLRSEFADVKSCICMTNGNYNTMIDVYVEECMDWFKSVDPEDADLYSTEGGCRAWASSIGLSVPASGSASTEALSTTLGASSSLTAAPATTPKTTAAPSQTASQTASQAGAAPNRAAGSGLVAWLAVVLPMAML